MKTLKALLIVASTAPFAVESEDLLIECAEQTVDYSASGIVKLRDRVVVKKLVARPVAVKEEDDPKYPPYSPQRTAAFNRIRVSDTTKAEPRDNSVEIFTVTGAVHAWQIDVHGMSDNLRLQWINDDLLFVQVWWGRILSTDLVFQVSSGKFLYAQEAHYGSLVQPCK